MRVNFRYVLILLCVIFSALYASFYFYGIEVRDLIANIIAALVTVLFIDWIVRKSELQKREHSINYVKRRITSVYTDLIWRMQPPKDWQERIAKKGSNWDDYYHKVWNTKENALHTLETLLDRYYDLISAIELTDDILEMVAILDDPIRWMMADPNTTLKRGPLTLHTISGDVTNVISQSINMIKRHRSLHDSTHLVITYGEGEPPQMKRQRVADVDAHIKRHYSFFDRILDESIKFRDENQKLLFKKKTGKK